MCSLLQSVSPLALWSWPLILLWSCGGGEGTGDSNTLAPDSGVDGGTNPVPNQVFRSGFEPNTEHVSDPSSDAHCTDDLRGEDLSVPDLGHWEQDLEGGLFGQAHFCFGGGTSDQRRVALVPDPEEPSNQVLHFWIAEPGENVSDDEIPCNGDAVGSRKARVQHLLLDNPNATQIDYRVRLRLGDGFQAIVDSPFDINWMTVGEFWNQQPNGDRSRVTINLIKEVAEPGAPFYFGIKADTQPAGEQTWTLIWPEAIVSNVVVPIGEWFTLRVSLESGDQATGHASFLVTTADGVTHEVADVTHWTRVPDGEPTGFTTLNTMKLYTAGQVVCGLEDAGHVLEVWWDDYAIGGS